MVMFEDESTVVSETVLDLVAAQAAAAPNATAVRAIDGTRTYAEVMEFAAAVSGALLMDGLEHEEPVAVYMRRTADLPAVLLGIMQAGGAYLPIDLQDPPDRLMTMLRIAGCRRIIGDALTLGNLPPVSESGIIALDVANIAPVMTKLARTPTSGTLAYVIFTSGSSGEPKAVEIEHQGMANTLKAARDLLAFTADDTFLAVTTLAFDISIIEVFLPLIVGADILLRDKQTLLEPQHMARLVREEGVTVVHTGPSVWSVILSQIPDFPRLRVAVSAGEAISPKLASVIAGYADRAWNMYGPTEATIWASGHILESGESANNAGISAPIGIEFPGVTVRIENPDCSLVSQGVEGELLLGDACVARGYRNRPELTAERFVLRDGSRYYRTGDRAVRNFDGVLEYKGRFDDQISIQGRRIEPREIEILIEKLPGIAHAAATWFETKSGTRAIVAAIVTEGVTQPDFAAIRNSLVSQIPESMIPAHFIALDALPINKNAKVDRAMIRGLLNDRICLFASTDDSTHMTATEKVIADVWARAMRVERIGPDSHFFAIGGDSLAAVTLNMRIEAALDILLPVQLVMEAPVLRDYAAMVDKIRAERFVQSDTSYIFPLTELPGTTPVFFVGVDLKLARNWRLPCSLYAIVFWASGGNMIEAETLEQLASVYVEGIRKLQPRGPYRIAGYSFGGVIALEIAQQLQGLGEEVECLFLLDPFYLSRTTSDTADKIIQHPFMGSSLSDRISQYGRESLADVRRHGLRGLIASLYKPVQKIRGAPWLLYNLYHLQAMTQLFRDRRGHPNTLQESLLPRNRWPIFWFSARKKAGEYIAHPYSGRSLALFTPNQGGEKAWADVLGSSKTTQLNAAHESVFEADAADQWQSELKALMRDPNFS
jgi:amino acid adenylation domain-containing protein